MTAPPNQPVKNLPPLLLLMQTNAIQGWRRMKTVRKQSRLLSSFIGFFIVGYLVLSFLLFKWGLQFLAHFPAIGPLLTERLFFLLFSFLLVLLLFSNLVIGYTNFFRNREATFLIPMPVPTQTIFQWKFLESALLASWAFLFLIAPLLAAYGLSRNAPWHFYFITLISIALFIVLPAAVGAWVALNLARFLDRRTFQVVAILCGSLLLLGAGLWFKPEIIGDDSTDVHVLATFDRLLQRTSFSEWPGLPSYWLSTSVLQWSEGALSAAGFFILVLLSNVLFFGSLCFTKTGKLFYEAFSTVHSRESIFGRWEWFRAWRKRTSHFDYPVGPVEKIFGVLGGMRQDVRAMLVKDARMFWRDTTQWGQTLVLFGLLGVYIINLRHFSEQLTNPFWVHLVSYLNLGACSLNLATLTTRFVYPQFSLEGKRLWIIGVAPLGVIEVVKAKFWLASRLAMLITVGLIVLSCHMLQMPLDRTFYFALIVGVMTFALTGLAIGLGALYPNFKEENPSKIVSGFGGTFCLVLSFLYIVGSVVVLAIGSPWGWRGETSISWILMSWIGFALFSIIIGWIPLQLGLRRLKTFEM